MTSKLIKIFPSEIDAKLQEATAFLEKQEYLKCAELAFKVLCSMTRYDGRYQQAEDMLYNAVGEPTDDKETLNILAEHCLFQRQHEKVILVFRKALGITPQGKHRAESFFKCAAALATSALDGPAGKRNERFEEAEGYYLSAIDCGVDLASAYNAMIALYSYWGKSEKIYFYANNIINVLGPNDKRVITAKNILRHAVDSYAEPDAVHPLLN